MIGPTNKLFPATNEKNPPAKPGDFLSFLNLSRIPFLYTKSGPLEGFHHGLLLPRVTICLPGNPSAAVPVD